MSAFAIIGANYGDEGKGLMTDYICFEKGADAVVRFNGGAQAGHTVVTPSGQRHVFHNYGSGSFLGVPTFLSRFFIVNPLLFMQEKMSGDVYVHPRAQVTTPFDMLLNQSFEKNGGHGSCGVGINETMQRVKAGYGLTMRDLHDGAWPDKLRLIYKEYAPKRIEQLGSKMPWGDVQMDLWQQVFADEVYPFMSRVTLALHPPGKNVVFEGAQGLMLDMDGADFPHVTHSKTGLHNVRHLMDDFRIQRCTAIYVTRSYLTRHGKGPLPGEEPMPEFVKDETNVPHEFQGNLRFARFTPQSINALAERIRDDSAGFPSEVAITCTDQYMSGSVMDMEKLLPVRYYSTGPTRYNVHHVKEKVQP